MKRISNWYNATEQLDVVGDLPEYVMSRWLIDESEYICYFLKQKISNLHVGSVDIGVLPITYASRHYNLREKIDEAYYVWYDDFISLNDAKIIDKISVDVILLV